MASLEFVIEAAVDDEVSRELRRMHSSLNIIELFAEPAWSVAAYRAPVHSNCSTHRCSSDTHETVVFDFEARKSFARDLVVLPREARTWAATLRYRSHRLMLLQLWPALSRAHAISERNIA